MYYVSELDRTRKFQIYQRNRGSLCTTANKDMTVNRQWPAIEVNITRAAKGKTNDCLVQQGVSQQSKENTRCKGLDETWYNYSSNKKNWNIIIQQSCGKAVLINS